MISNLEAFLAVASEAHLEMRRLVDEGRTPKPDGSPGYVVAWDPQGRSFKQALITVVFAGIYYEALTYFVARHRSKSQAQKVDSTDYRGKLVALGITDVDLLLAAESFRKSRNDLVHEKAAPPEEVDWAQARAAQSSADEAMEFVAAVKVALAAAL